MPHCGAKAAPEMSLVMATAMHVLRTLGTVSQHGQAIEALREEQHSVRTGCELGP
jgi:hypothetical protein